MKRILLALSLLIWAYGCSSTPQVRYYQMSAPQEAKPIESDLVIGVEPFLIDSAYDDQRMVYRTSEYRLDYYHYHRWSAPPGVMVSDYVRTALTQTGEFKSVLTGFTADASTMVGGRIVAFEEVDKSGDDWVARLRMELYLRDASNGRLIWSKSVEAEESLPDQNPEGVAAAMSEVLTRVINEAAPEIRRQSERLAKEVEPNVSDEEE